MNYRSSAAGYSPLLIVTVEGKVAAIDMESGREVWRNSLSGAGMGVVEVWVEGATVLVAPVSNVIVALRYTTGEEIWRATTTGSGRASILVEGQRVIVARGGYVDCFDPNGQRLWSNELSGLGMGATGIALLGTSRQADYAGRK
jgi:outer membrane protein assembly factor BamB